MFVAFAMTAFAQNPISSIEDFKPGKIYWFEWAWLQPYTYSTAMYPDSEESPELNGLIWSSYSLQIPNDINDPRQQFTVVECDGKLYLYNIGAGKFVAHKNDGAHLMDIPTSYVAVLENTYGDANFPWSLAFDGDKLIAAYPQTGYDYSGYMYCSGANLANQIYAISISEVGDYAAVDSLTEVLANNLVLGEQQRQQALDSLSIVIENVDLFIIEDLQYSATGGGKVELQVTDPAAANYLWANYPEPNEGPIAGLIDGDTGTFFHSQWSNPVPQDTHWIQVDLEAPLQNFSFNYHTRVFDGGNDFPDAIEVQGSNDGVEFTPIAVFDKDLPQMSNKSWESGDINADQPYKYLRFSVTAERIYWHMSEFGLNELASEVAAENYLPHVTYIRELVALYAEANEMYLRGDDKADDIMAMITELNDLVELIRGLGSEADDPKTIEYIAEVKEIYNLQGVGYPTGAGRDAFKAAIDVAEAKPTTLARMTLAEALQEYYKTEEVVMPTNGTKYTLTFVTYGGRRNFLDYVAVEGGDYTLSMVQDTLTSQGLSYPETAVFTCEDNEDGTYSFVTYDGKYLTLPGGGAASGSATGISESKVGLTLVKMYPNAKCEADVTYEMLFGLMAYQVNGTFPAPNSSGSTFYHGALPHFMGSWTSAMAIEEYVAGEDTGIDRIAGETTVEGIYDLSGRRVENPVKGIYIVNGKKVLVK